MIRVYTTEICPRCKQLKAVLDAKSINYEEIDMTSPEARTELIINNVFAISAPVLQVNEEFIESDHLFDNDSVKHDIVASVISNYRI